MLICKFIVNTDYSCFVIDFSVEINIGLSFLFPFIFSVTHVQVLHRKMLQTNKEYRVNVLD